LRRQGAATVQPFQNIRDCRLCGSVLGGEYLDLGDLPPCNRFFANPAAPPVQNLSIACCGSCGLIQLVEPPAIEAVRPRVPWIRYNEPDAHLDDLVDRLRAACPRTTPTAFGVGPFEAPLLDRLSRYGGTHHINLIPSHGDAEGYPYLETWQARLDAAMVEAVARVHGTADIVSCRYLLEHCHAPKLALDALSRLLAPSGILVIEVPDSSKFLAACDYCFLWEEHVSYFVEQTFAAMAQAAGYDVIGMMRYPGELEDALVGIFRRRDQSTGPAAGGGGGDAVATDQFARYRASFRPIRAKLESRLAALAGPERDGVALFGVGHQAIMFVNALGVGPYIGTVVDDDVNKLKMFPPGLPVAITSSAALVENPRVRACLLAVSPRAEQKVADKLAPLLASGVKLHTIYAARPGSIVAG
jgi:SAM-dependent methyltransferase